MNRTLHVIYIGIFFLFGITITIGLTVNGFTYYGTPLDERFFSINHEMLKPSGTIGHGLGIVGSAMIIVGVAVYMIRKRVKRFVRAGLLKHWLELHIFLCSVGPILILFHTSFKFGGLVAVSFWSMVTVVFSGIIGRFIYVQIPRTIHGKELDIKELDEINEQLTFTLRNEYNINETILQRIEELSSTEKYKKLNLRQSITLIPVEYFAIKRVLKDMKKNIDKNWHRNTKGMLKTVKQKLVISRKIGMYRSMQKLFKYWHVAHLPFAMIMFFIMLIHIAVAVAFGYIWIF